MGTYNFLITQTSQFFSIFRYILFLTQKEQKNKLAKNNIQTKYQ
jgi:hypothetical protein